MRASQQVCAQLDSQSGICYGQSMARYPEFETPPNNGYAGPEDALAMWLGEQFRQRTAAEPLTDTQLNQVGTLIEALYAHLVRETYGELTADAAQDFMETFYIAAKDWTKDSPAVQDASDVDPVFTHSQPLRSRRIAVETIPISELSTEDVRAGLRDLHEERERALAAGDEGWFEAVEQAIAQGNQILEERGEEE